MTEKKLTESEIMKALEELEEVCEQECPHEEGGRECMQYKCLYIPPKPILDLITDKNDSIEMYRRNIALLDEQILEKDKEIERLQKAIKSARNYAWQMKTEKENLIKTYKECQTEAIKDVLKQITMEIEEALRNNFKVRQERQDKVTKGGGNVFGDEIICTIDGKISALMGIGYFVDQIAKEMGVEL